MKTVTLKDLVMQVDKEQAVTYLIENVAWYYKDYSEDAYRKAGANLLDTLRGMDPVDTNLVLSVWHEDNKGYDISGFRSDDPMAFSLVTTPWNVWLGMLVAEDTLNRLSPAQIVGYSMYEMTYFGWTEEQRTENMAKVFGGKQD